jgi:hypothetical protein
MIHLSIRRLLLVPFLAGLVSAQTATFDASAQGWTNVTLPFPNPGNPPIELGPGVVQHFAAGGNPGGYLQVTDPDGSQPTGHVQWWKAPATWLGDKSGHYGGELRYDVKVFTSLVWFQHEDILLTGNGTTLAYFANLTLATNVWTQFTAPIAVGSWRIGNRNGPLATQAQIVNVLSSLTSIYLRAEFQNNLDTFGIDNAAFLPPVASTQTYGTGCGGGAEVAPVILALSQPVLGSTYTIGCTAPLSSVVGLVIHGLTKFDPGIDLSGLGLIGCTLHTSLDVLVAEAVVGGVCLSSLAIPNDPSWAGLHIHSQIGVFAPVNPFGMILSPALEAIVGS